MAKVKFYSGTRDKVNAKAVEQGAIYVATDTEEIAVDTDNGRFFLSKPTWVSMSNTSTTNNN